ncbi:MAG: hypothetical protein K2Q34_06215 [Alphaproteobacteria bacterium]|nr:hypothetical protein [Alphaproteobacteria bacterium]
MSNFSKIFFIVLFLFQFAFASDPHSTAAASASDSAPFQVKIFDVGQGNCVAIKYNGRSILIDCGTKSLTYTAQYHKAAGKGKTAHLSGGAGGGGGGSAAAEADSSSDEGSDTEAATKALSKATLHPTTPSPKTKLKAGVTPGRKARDSSSEDSGGEADTKEKEALRETYKKKIIKEISDFLGNTIQAVVITHPDEDHYSLIPAVTEGKTVEKVIVSGQDENYLDSKKVALQSFRTWITDYATADKILSTDEFYFSGKDPKSAIEGKIEEAITFTPSASGASEPPPEIEILAMNASAGGTRESNADSIVLKITYKGQSILLPGDATDVTWEKIRTTNPGNLRSNYFLISHHGAATHGSTSAEILSEIGPQAVFVSAGRYKGYCHPDRSVIDTLLSSSGLGEDEDSQRFVTYFSEQKKHRRLTTSSLLFTTLNNGTITIDLGRGEAHMTHAKAPTQYHFGSKLYTADKNFAFREQSISDPTNPARLFSNLIKEVLGEENVCFFRIQPPKADGIATLALDAAKTDSAAADTCEHAFLIKQKTSTDKEIIVYLQDIATASSGTTGGSGGSHK